MTNYIKELIISAIKKKLIKTYLFKNLHAHPSDGIKQT